MFAVIFYAKIKTLDEEYFQTAKRLRELAMEKYGCVKFISASEGDEEIAISYWHDKKQIAAWKQDAEHQAAQRLGKEKWYESYRIEIAEIVSRD